MSAMNVLTIALDSIQQDSRRVETASMNVANSLTPGYKRRFPALRELTMGVLHDAGDVTPRHGAAAVLPLTDMRPGTLRATRRSLDVALTGNGFFEVLTPTGPAYTRHGEFHLDGAGRLVTAQGEAVAGEAGEIVLRTRTPSINAQGLVEEDGKSAGQLKVVVFEHPERLVHLGGGRYVPAVDAGRAMLPADIGTGIEVRQGYLENANVSAMQDMLDLMQSMRHMETMQKVTQYADDMLGTAIRRLGEA